MALPPVVLDPPFNVLRISHIELNVTDLAASKKFYGDTLGLALTGLAFEDALIFAVAGISTTGRLIEVADSGLHYSEISDTAKAILCAAMVLGRLETLAVVALLNPDYWR